ncbi:twin-arginine translocase subunit TatC [Candidatus Nitrosocosmicus arcticus]|uniref:Sec-independent protein translocase protein TatC n=1 Tax=Candidatus Nitrosocosmicus arcticus TaxID=2035267 RepID=A0A557SV03_9ARCH|nr:twin-arginine translocase subunit TatC [Candidatus Nitrosocosmicus arcticus]TVP40426.1 Sec-independent protein translocase protein TatC [Candidatus Nitrosocosmicus arcticus]
MINISEDKPIVKLLYELRVRTIRICIVIIIIILVCMTLGFTAVNFHGYHFLILYPDSFNSISVQIISQIRNDLLPNAVDLVQVTPGQAFTAQMYVSIIIGIVSGLPVIIGELFAFLNPALHHYEKKIIKGIMLPVMALFILGCLFSYFIVIPYTLDFLYNYGQSMGVVSFFEIIPFIIFVLNLLIIFGFAYQLPIIMWTVTKTKFVKPDFWKKNFRYILIVLVIVGAIITPDGSGLTMWFIVGPMMLLYFIGMTIIKVDSKMSRIQD